MGATEYILDEQWKKIQKKKVRKEVRVQGKEKNKIVVIILGYFVLPSPCHSILKPLLTMDPPKNVKRSCRIARLH